MILHKPAVALFHKHPTHSRCIAYSLSLVHAALFFTIILQLIDSLRVHRYMRKHPRISAVQLSIASGSGGQAIIRTLVAVARVNTR